MDTIDCAEITEPFVPIGADKTFKGSFYGNGYLIKNLKIETNKRYVGLFGAVTSSTIGNIVLDSSCSIKSTLDDTEKVNVFIGSIAGSASNTVVCGCINYANVTFSGHLTNENSTVDMGGIAGYLFVRNDKVDRIGDSANYGNVVIENDIKSKVHVGGVFGRISEVSYDAYYSPLYTLFANCHNSGLISMAGTSATGSVGGIIGYVTNVNIKYCVNAQNVSVPGFSYSVGSIIGMSSYTYSVTNNYFNNINEHSVIGGFSGTQVTVDKNYRYNPSTFVVDNDYNSTLFNLLRGNSYISTSIWVSNVDAHHVAIVLDCAKSFETSEKLFLLPGKVNSGTSLKFWYLDEKMFDSIYDVADEGIVNDTTLWGGFGSDRCDAYKLTGVALSFNGDVSKSEWKPFVKDCAECDDCYDVTDWFYFEMNDETLLWIDFDTHDQAVNFIANARS